MTAEFSDELKSKVKEMVAQISAEDTKSRTFFIRVRTGKSVMPITSHCSKKVSTLRGWLHLAIALTTLRSALTSYRAIKRLSR